MATELQGEKGDASVDTTDAHDSQGSPKPAESPQGSLSPDQRRTLMYAVGAAVCLAITGLFEWSSRPAAIEEFGKIGEEFYADFTDPTLAASLEVYVFDAEEVKPLDFRVQRLENGRWVIPSHHDYPADAEDQLAKTAASIIGIRRGAMVTRWEADHAQFGVVNPKQDSLSIGDVEGVGKRIILRGDDESVLADYIIGDKVEDQTNQYYVRHPDEEEVYLATVDIDLSTKFSDWIDTDLVDANAWDMTEITINDYSFDELQNKVTEQEVSKFVRKTSSDPWQMEGLNEELEEVDTTAIGDTVTAIADLKIAGVRAKQKGLTPDLKLDRQALNSQRDVSRLQSDLLTRGFLLRPGENNDQENLVLLAREGELHAATNEGLIYRLYFGRAFAGSEEELEIGLSAESDAAEGDAASEEANGGESTDDADGTAANESEKPGRYVFVRVDFDAKYLGDEPVKPVEPTKPAELDAATDTPVEGTESSDQPDEDAADSDSAPEAPADPLEAIRTQYEAAKQQYETDLAEYERKADELKTKVEDGQKKAEELNRRFAEWYYVIPGDSFDKLRLSRADLVKAKEKDEETTEPQTTEPQTTEPQTTEPQSTEPQSTEPQASEPQSTEPQTTEPQTSEAQTTEGETSATPSIPE